MQTISNYSHTQKPHIIFVTAMKPFLLTKDFWTRKRFRFFEFCSCSRKW